MTVNRSPASRPSRPPESTPLAVCAERLFAGRQELRINYRGQEYRLRQTRNGKLILTK